MSECAQAWPLVVDFMRRRCGLVLRDDQAYLLTSRLAPVARSLGYPSILRFVTETTAPNAPARAVLLLLDAMTTHETSFFRDAGFWDSFAQKVVPHLKATVAALGTATVWCAACSTGQEPYTVAMLLEELEPTIAPAVKISGTDVSALVVERAREGVFSVLETGRGLHARRLVQHFEPDPNGFRIKPHLRQRVDWEAHNLLGAAPSPRNCEVVLCRNVLIYFDPTDRTAVIERLFAAVRAGGFVGVGTTELLPGPSVSPGWYATRAAADLARAQ